MTAVLPEHTLVKGAAASDVTTSGNINTNTAVAMSISAEGTAHIMSLLTDLYSDPNLAVLREYSSNAKDSHVEAGQTKPIEVTLPSRMSPVFVVEDFGIGMSVDTINTIYSSYGASTKRNDFSQVGAFGLGCKSALTMTQQFTLISIKDGVKATVLISRGNDGVGQVNVVSVIETDKPNGVKVSVPIQDVSAFNQNVPDFFKWWTPGTVLVDGKSPHSVFDDKYFTLADGKTHIRDKTKNNRYSEGTIHLIMGEIAYDVKFPQLDIPFRYSNNSSVESCSLAAINSVFNVIIEVPIGSIDLTPSREDIRYSERTKEYIKSLIIHVGTSLGPYFTNLMDNIATREEAFRFVVSNSDMFSDPSIIKLMDISNTELTWNGETVQTEFEQDNDDEMYRFSVRKNYDYDAKRAFKCSEPFYIGRVYVSGYKMFSSNPDLKVAYVIRPPETDKKIRESQEKVMRRELPMWFEHTEGVDESTYYENIYFIDSKPDSKWFRENAIFEEIKYDDIREAAKAVRALDRKNAAAGTAKKTEYFYTTYKYVSDLALRPDGSKALVIENTSHLDLPTTGYYFEYFDVGDIPGFKNSYGEKTATYNRAHRNTGGMEELFTAGGLTEDDVVIQVGRGMTYQALCNRTKGTYTHIRIHAKKQVKSALDAIPEEELALYAIFDAWGENSLIRSGGCVYYMHSLTPFVDSFKKDKELFKIITLAGKVNADKKKYDSIIRLNNTHALTVISQTKVELLGYSWKAMLDKYPLLPVHYGEIDNTSEQFTKHLNAYIKTTAKEVTR